MRWLVIRSSGHQVILLLAADIIWVMRWDFGMIL